MVSSEDLQRLAWQARAAWEANAAWWVARIRAQPGGDVFRREVLTPKLLATVPTNATRVLDLGCGEGYLARMLAVAGADVVGVDWSVSMIAEAKRSTPQKERASYVVADAAGGLPFPDESFGTVVSNMAVMDVVGLDETCAHASRVTAPRGSGLWIVLDPDGVRSAPTDYFELVRREPCRVPRAEWAAWVRIAPDQPHPTLYVHREIAEYCDALSQAGLQIESSEVLSRDGLPRAVLIRTVKTG